MHDIITTDFGSKIFWGFRTKRVSSMRANWLFQVNLFDIFFRCLKMRDSHNSYQKDNIFFSRKALEYCFFFGGGGNHQPIFLHQHHSFFSWFPEILLYLLLGFHTTWWTASDVAFVHSQSSGKRLGIQRANEKFPSGSEVVYTLETWRGSK